MPEEAPEQKKPEEKKPEEESKGKPEKPKYVSLADFQAFEKRMNKVISQKETEVKAAKAERDEAKDQLRSALDDADMAKLFGDDEEKKAAYRQVREAEVKLKHREQDLDTRETDLAKREVELVVAHWHGQGVPLDVLEGQNDPRDVKMAAQGWLLEQKKTKEEEEGADKRNPGYENKSSTRTKPDFTSMTDKQVEEWEAAEKRKATAKALGR